MTPTQKTIALNSLNQTLMQFGQNIGLGSFALDENRSASLIFDDRFLVELQALDYEGDQVRTLYLIAVLCADSTHVDDGAAASFYQKLLQSNLSGKVMSGVSFAFDKEHNEILLLRPLSVSQLALNDLEQEMENFVNVLEQWAGCLKNGMLDWNNTQVEQGDATGDTLNSTPNAMSGGFRV